MRLFLPGGSVISKEPLGPDAARRLEHEVAILRRLADVPGVAQLAPGPRSPRTLLLADTDGVRLADRATPWSADALTDLALELAHALAGMHRRAVMHLDVSPANIVVSGFPGVLCLIDFSLATTFEESHRRSDGDAEIVGTLPYLAPEQMGRMERMVDQRADLYASGAVLYELATGHPPFGAGDPLKLVHDHLAREPVPPAQVNPAVPVRLSDIIMHLLEKEPDRRYQTAEGLAHDLERLRTSASGPRRVGEHDFPHRLRPPTRTIGRDAEIATLGATFASAMAGGTPGVLVTGPAGAGKTTLIEELRPIVSASGGWFVSGKFDQYRRDLDADGIHQAFRALGRLLLALPEDEVADTRERIVRALGANAGLAAAVTPEMASLLGVPPDIGDPLTVEARAQRNAIQILRMVASRHRPVVFVVDDLQWADRTSLGFIEQVLSGDERIDGLLLVGAYRDDDATDSTQRLNALVSPAPAEREVLTRVIRLGRLSGSSLAALVADVLERDVDEVGDLVDAIAPRVDGNPYQTTELLGAMRREGILAPGERGWRWEAGALRGGLGRLDLPRLLAARLSDLPAPTRTLAEVMACLGGRVHLDVLEVAVEKPAEAVRALLVPAAEDGLLVIEPGVQQMVRFRHDRLQEGVLAAMSAPRRQALRLRLARRLGARPDQFAAAASQYLPVVDSLDDVDERAHVVALLRRAADEAQMTGNLPVVEKLLVAAVGLVEPDDSALKIALETGRMVALCGLGRLPEADDAYRIIDELSTSPAQRTDATLVQVASLANRSRPTEAVALGIQLLRRLGVAVPAPQQIEAEIDRELEALYRWLAQTTEDDDLARPEITDPSRLAVAALINRMMPPTFQSDLDMMAWLVLYAARMWADDGPGATLVGPVSHMPFVMTRRRQDYRTGYQVARRILSVADARAYEPDVSQSRFLFAFGAGHWFEPLEECISEARRAFDGLLQAGDLQNACWTAGVLVYALWDAAPSLDAFRVEAEAALGLALRTGNQHSAQLTQPYLSLEATLSGHPLPDANAAADTEQLRSNPTVASNAHICRAIAAALLDDQRDLDTQSAKAMELLPFVENIYPSTAALLTRALSLARQARQSALHSNERAELLGALDKVTAWWAARAADAPTNFRHLLRLVQAEQAWALNDFQAAGSAFDAAQRDVGEVQRPWHRALITEHAAEFHLAQGWEHTGNLLLTEAVAAYAAWGAETKVSQLRQTHPRLAVPRGAPVWPLANPADASAHRASIMTGAIDLLGILAASQALSSTTTVEGLRERVVEILSDMTGATGVQLLLHDQQSKGWRLPTATSGAGPISLDAASRRQPFPQSALRYVERTRAPLVVGDAVSDDRFARDPYFNGYECCSLLVVPILNRSKLEALVVLENRFIRNAFSIERIDGVMLIAGQLAVSLDNAEVYASLEHKVADRTRQLAIANERLERLSITDSLTGLANRRRFEEVLNSEWRRAQSTGRTLSLAMVDIDDFKLYNDRYGHPAGDECLSRVATQLRRSSAGSDLVARYGGEEFAIIMPDTDLSSAHCRAERIRAAVVALAESHQAVAGGIVTASIGVTAANPPVTGTADQLVERADVELYRAKRAGRNRVIATNRDA